MNTSASELNNTVVSRAASVTTSAVSWAAIFAGAAAAAAVSLILVILGTGLGLAAVSPWDYAGISAATLGLSTVIWLTFTQLVASGLGGYLAGRLRVRWSDVHVDEVFFRDTAHGLLSWAVASLLMAMLFASTFTSLVGAGVKAGATAVGAGGMVAAVPRTDAGRPGRAGEGGMLDYWADSLLRSDGSALPATAAPPASAPSTPAGTAGTGPVEVTRILMNAQTTGALPKEDVQYLGQLVARRTGVTQEAGEQRVRDTYARLQAHLKQMEVSAKETAEKARKATAYASLWLFVALLVGAFFASLLATIGGRERDR